MIVLLGAFPQEIAGLRRQMIVEDVVATPVCTVYRGKLNRQDCLLVQTGMGKERAENATHFVLQSYPVTGILSLGFAGALTSDLTIGDVVVCSTMYGASRFDGEEGELEACATDANLLALASHPPGDGTTPFSLGSGVTVMRLDSSPPRMQELSRRFQAQIVDMESYWIAAIASARQVPFIAVRSISDTIQHSVQPFDRILTSDGRLLWRKAVLCFLFHPRYLMNVFTLFKSTRLAERNLTAFVSHLVSKIEARDEISARLAVKATSTQPGATSKTGA